MKKLVYITLFSVLGFIACKKKEMPTSNVTASNNDICQDVDCGDHGNCNGQGNCICEAGWEKNSNNLCNIAWAEKFVKSSINSKDVCTPGSVNPGEFTYNTELIKENPTTLISKNLFGYGSSNVIKINVLSTNEVSIDYTDIAGRYFTATGIKEGDTLALNAVILFPNSSSSDTCKTTLVY